MSCLFFISASISGARLVGRDSGRQDRDYTRELRPVYRLTTVISAQMLQSTGDQIYTHRQLIESYTDQLTN